MSRDFGVNQALVEDIFLKWLANPKNVDASWQEFFASLPPQDWPDLTSHGQIPAPLIEPPKRRSESSGGTSSGGTGDVDAPYRHPRSSGDYLPSLPPTAELVPFIADSTRQRATTSFPPTHDVLAANELQGRVSALVNAYRVRGHLFADLDPLRLQSQLPNEFLLEHYGLADVDLSTIFSTGDMAGPATMTLGEIVQKLNETYTRSIGVEFTFLEDRQARRWLQESMESTNNRVPLSREEQLRILRKLTDAEIFEQFLHTKFKGAKRFSLEGGESVISMLDYLVERSAACGVQEIVIGMAHRGRLNVLANILEMNVRDIFAGFEDGSPENHLGGGDVKYHLGWSTDRVTRSGDKVHLTLAFNPSHLEFVNPVVEGRVRAKQDRFGDEARSRVLPLIIHGDAAIAGQGVVAETLNLSELTAYATGGTIHLVINNQIGFTTIPNDSRSSRYCTDITRMLRCPVFHVNGEDPEAVTQVIRLATEFRQRYHRDVVIDLYCYRKYGHNEGDEPRFTQPLMYAAVDEKRTVREVYVDYLDETQSVPRSEAAALSEKRRQDLETALQETRRGDYDLVPDSMRGVWSGYHGGLESKSPNVSTGVAKYTLRALIEKLTTVPSDFTPHRTIKRAVLDRQKSYLKEEDPKLDWGTAENLAMASLLVEGTRVRLTGQDVRRGTFSHRHAVIFDVNTGTRYTRLGHLTQDQATLEIYDSPLSEAGVLGFEWGYSLDSPDALVVWEAQFGDFANSAQVIIDQFVVSSEDKWHRLSGLTMLLPHGFEGQGPEHSSARLERFLSLCAEDNIQVCNVTTPAQVFHMLRRQVVRPWRKPLIVMTPKSLLRHPKAQSKLSELSEGQFHKILHDIPGESNNVNRVLFCSGKIYYDLVAKRDELDRKDVAIVRLEQLYPLSKDELSEALGTYPSSAELIWVQEEPWNMGPWLFFSARMRHLFGEQHKLACVARPESASPATGSKAAHDLEQRWLIEQALGLRDKWGAVAAE